MCGCGCVWGERGFKGSNKVQTRLTALVQKGSNAPDGAGSKVQERNGDRERECVGVWVCGKWGQGKRVCGCGGMCGGEEKKLKC